MLIEILTRPESNQVHLEFLIGEVWNNKELDVSASKVSFQQLIAQKSIRDISLLKTFLKLGLPLLKDDIVVTVAVNELPIEQLQVFKDLVFKLEYSQEYLDYLCEVAVSAKKAPFVVVFVQLGASLPSVHGDLITNLLITVLKRKDYDGAKALIEKFTEAISDDIDLAFLMDSNIVNRPELIKMLIRTGLNPNGSGRRTPIAVVMSKQHLTMSKKIELISLLLESGEDCSHLHQTSKSFSTPLHVATELALQSGKFHMHRWTFSCTVEFSDACMCINHSYPFLCRGRLKAH